MALVLINLGDVARERGEEDRAVALYNDALAMHRELGNERGVARALERLARVGSGSQMKGTSVDPIIRFR